ncbi:hypothetical protein BDB13_6075 [Rhodococcus sp. OK302]|nr:hypothetical protein BDB13_6075 [Rhodococcus sp. OK302]
MYGMEPVARHGEGMATSLWMIDDEAMKGASYCNTPPDVSDRDAQPYPLRAVTVCGLGRRATPGHYSRYALKPVSLIHLSK